jgi:hypothetical protein
MDDFPAKTGGMAGANCNSTGLIVTIGARFSPNTAYL